MAHAINPSVLAECCKPNILDAARHGPVGDKAVNPTVALMAARPAIR